MAKRPAKKQGPREPGEQIVIRWGGKDRVKVNGGTVMMEAAMRWTRILRNRRRWADNADSPLEQRDRILNLVRDLGIDPEVLAEAEGLVEVRVPYQSEPMLWEGRIFPWEPVIAAVTAETRGARPLTVVRHLKHAGARAPTTTPFRRVLYVETAPGPLLDGYDFENERRLVREGFGVSDSAYLELINPTEQSLRRAVSDHKPDVIHVAGIDPHQARELLGSDYMKFVRPLGVSADARGSDGELGRHVDQPVDGILLNADGKAITLAPAARAAKILCGVHAPRLVCFNLYNSAARLAALTVAAGAGAAVGFQDEVDDRVAETLYTNLYSALRATDHVAEAFSFAWRAVLSQPAHLRGSGVVLWGDQPWQKEAGHATRRAKLIDSATRVLTAENVPPDQLRVEVVPVAELNYSMLQNRRSMFEKFVLHKPPGRMENVCVEVQLDSTQAYRACVTADNRPHVLADGVRVPLTSSLARSGRESVATTMRVEVKWNDRTLHHDTYRVMLLPVDVWRDDDENRVWLPSFVLPRDPSVNGLIRRAEGSLRTLTDDRSAGFDGYQQVDAKNPDSLESVDLQVEAIWGALAYQAGLTYVNPLPSYPDASQRLRRPCEVVDGGRGTCIDLALMLAACLEFVDIYPVLFLLEGHAFAGYWRSPDAFEDFGGWGGDDDLLTEAAKRGFEGSAGGTYPWSVTRSQYQEVLREVHRGNLVPLETTLLCGGGSFADAIDDGAANLRNRTEFNSMIDIVMARRNKVTPLPVREENL